jgi:hypothetical protein
MSEAPLLPRKLLSNYLLFKVLSFHFMSDPDPNPEPYSKCVPIPLRQKVPVPAVPVSVTELRTIKTGY